MLTWSSKCPLSRIISITSSESEAEKPFQFRSVICLSFHGTCENRSTALRIDSCHQSGRACNERNSLLSQDCSKARTDSDDQTCLPTEEGPVSHLFRAAATPTTPIYRLSIFGAGAGIDLNLHRKPCHSGLASTPKTVPDAQFHTEVEVTTA